MAGLTDRLDGDIVAPDLIGHGTALAPSDVAPYRMAAIVADLVESIGTAHVVGYSMGGRIALSLAVAAPERVRSLTLIGASPGLRTIEERQARVKRDAALAQDIERDGIEAFVLRWENLPLFASQQSLDGKVLERQRQTRLAQRPHGLANSLRGCGTGSMPPLHDALSDLRMPALCLAGESDITYATIGNEMAAALPAGSFAVVPGAGHAAHLEDPDTTASLVREFIEAHP